MVKKKPPLSIFLEENLLTQLEKTLESLPNSYTTACDLCGQQLEPNFRLVL
jgi:hypothetical protein